MSVKSLSRKNTMKEKKKKEQKIVNISDPGSTENHQDEISQSKENASLVDSDSDLEAQLAQNFLKIPQGSSGLQTAGVSIERSGYDPSPNFSTGTKGEDNYQLST